MQLKTFKKSKSAAKLQPYADSRVEGSDEINHKTHTTRNIKKSKTRKYLYSVAFLSLVSCIACIYLIFLAYSKFNTEINIYQIDLSSALEVANSLDAAKRNQFNEKSEKIRKGDNLSLILKRIGQSKHTNSLVRADKKRIFRKLIPGEVIEYSIDKSNNLQQVRYVKSPFLKYDFSRVNKGWTSYQTVYQPNIKIHEKAITLNESIFIDGGKNGISDKTLFNMTDLFAWDIDFTREVYKGDQFKIIYTSYYDEFDRLVSDGEILAAQFHGRKKYNIFLYKKDGKNIGYFDEKGIAAQKSFLRNPVKFSRISSRYNPYRLHPISKKIRAHKGVDYAAARGTPIYATAKGYISYKGWKGGYGRTIIIQHFNKYSTLYAHMYRYARGMRRGKKVKQGQLIGYVGSSGYSTGPHLHYEFRVRGVHRDPLKVKFPSLYKKIKKYDMDDFVQKIQPNLEKLENLTPQSSKVKAV